VRTPNIQRPVKLTTNLPEDVRVRLDLHLYSEVEGRIPKGAYSTFLIDRIREFFDAARMDLHTYFPHLPEGQYILRGPIETIGKLAVCLEEKRNVER